MNLPDLVQLHPWMNPQLARQAAQNDWLESVVVNSLISFLADQILETAPEDELEQERERLISAYHLRGRDHFAAWCELRGLSNSDLQFYLSRSWRWRRWVESQFENNLESLYLLRQNAYTSYLISILQLDSYGLAQELYLRIKEDDVSFDYLARQYSLGRESNSGGVLGPVLAANLHPALLGALQHMQPGQLSEPFLMNDQWVLLRLDERRTPLMDGTMRRLLLDDHSHRWLLEQARQIIAVYLRQNIP